MSVTIPPLHQMPSWRAQGQRHLPSVIHEDCCKRTVIRIWEYSIQLLGKVLECKGHYHMFDLRLSLKVALPKCLQQAAAGIFTYPKL
jgi:hypothetical protein